MTAPQPGIIFTGSYRTGNYNVGATGPTESRLTGPVSVLDTLANPAATATASQTSGRSKEQALGVKKLATTAGGQGFNAATAGLTANIDPMKTFYDAAGVMGVANPNYP